MSENQVEKSQFRVTSPLLPRLGDGALHSSARCRPSSPRCSHGYTLEEVREGA